MQLNANGSPRSFVEVFQNDDLPHAQVFSSRVRSRVEFIETIADEDFARTHISNVLANFIKRRTESRESEDG